jgi:hypothetical protein
MWIKVPKPILPNLWNCFHFVIGPSAQIPMSYPARAISLTRHVKAALMPRRVKALGATALPRANVREADSHDPAGHL